MPVNKQLEILLEELGISQREFAKQTGMSNQTVNNIITNRHITKSDILERILTRYPDLNMNWLLTGLGKRWNTAKRNKTVVKILATTSADKIVLKEKTKEIEHFKEIVQLKDEIINGLKAQINNK